MKVMALKKRGTGGVVKTKTPHDCGSVKRKQKL